MNICIDQGNSRTKVALFQNGKLTHHFIYKAFASSDVERLFALYPITDSIISSVVNIEPAVVNTLHRLSRQFILFDHVKKSSRIICDLRQTPVVPTGLEHQLRVKVRDTSGQEADFEAPILY